MQIWLATTVLRAAAPAPHVVGLPGESLLGIDSAIEPPLSATSRYGCCWPTAGSVRPFRTSLLQAEGLFDSSGRAFDGMLYPSRKNRGKEALALASTYVDEARPGIIHTEQPFKDTPEYRQLLADPLRIAKP